jgi:hypothetical protein|uniref:Uncharacterized protein n=1 Tax=virus sp. ctoYX9 TaxID=2825822 RepID=A0A8S5RNV0_9VIRU|nr:MAG TPA: hypothetical protein [virus sp. ctoYX9]
MYLKEETARLTGDLKAAVRKWAYGKIDELAADRPKLKAATVYLKRGLSNYMEREDKRINSMVDSLTLFVADKDGKIDTDMLIDDAVTMFKEMDVAYAEIGSFGIEYGKGAVTINIPHNVFLDMIFGDLGQIRITAEDLLEIKQLMEA